MFLEPEQVEQLTRRKRRPAQVRMLRSMGVEHKVRADGSIAILEKHVEQLFGAAPASTAKKPKTFTPNWSAINGARP